MTVTDAGAAGCQFASADPASPANVADNYSGPTDWRGLWFELDEKKANSSACVPAVRAPMAAWTGGSSPISSMTASAVSKRFPESRWLRRSVRSQTLNETRRPNLRKRAAALWRHFFKPPVTAAAWQTLDPQWKPHPGQPALAPQSPRSRSIRTARSAWRVPPNSIGSHSRSLLLSALARASEADLGPGPALWVIPVNMRGAVKTSRESANHGSYLDVELRRGATAREVHEKIKAGFHNLEHWGAWAMLNAGRVVGYDGASPD